MLLTRAPHLVLDGLQLVAEATQRRRGLRVRAGRPRAHRSRPHWRSAAAWTGSRSPSSRRPTASSPVRNLLLVSAAFGWSGASRATRRAWSSRRACAVARRSCTTSRRSPISRSRRGADPPGFARPARRRSPAPSSSTVSGGVANPGVYELGYGIALGDLLDAAGGPSAPLQAVLIGGYHGAWVPWPAAAERPRFPRRAAPVRRVTGSRRHRGACRLSTCGLAQTSPDPQLPRRAERRPVRAVPERAAQAGRSFERWSGPRDEPCAGGSAGRGAGGSPGLVEGRGACHHPDGTVRLVRSALRDVRP